MKNYSDINGNMGEITSSQNRIGRYDQKVIPRNSEGKSLGKIIRNASLIAGALTLIGIGTYKLTDYLIKKDHVDSVNRVNEDILDRRTRLLSLASEQLRDAQDSEIINGLNLVIKDIENGVYDYNK